MGQEMCHYYASYFDCPMSIFVDIYLYIGTNLEVPILNIIVRKGQIVY